MLGLRLNRSQHSTMLNQFVVSKFNGTSDSAKVIDNAYTNLGQLPYTDSGDVTSHQGVIVSPDYIYTIDTNVIYKRNKTTLEVISSNNNIFGGIAGMNHLGDGCYLNGKLYLVSENWNGTGGTVIHIMEYNADTLAFIRAFDISSTTDEGAGMGTDGTYFYVVSYITPSFVKKYNLDGSFVSTITLSKNGENHQGISICDGEMYISSQNQGVRAYLLNGTFKRHCVFYDQQSTHYFEGLDFSTDTNVCIRQIRDVATNYIRFYDPNQKKISGFGYKVSLNLTGSAAEQAIVSRYGYNVNKRQLYLLVSSNQFAFRMGNGVSTVITALPASTGWKTIKGWLNTIDSTSNVSNGITSASVNFPYTYFLFNQNTGIGCLADTPVLAPFGGNIQNVELFYVIDGIEVPFVIWKFNKKGATTIADSLGKANNAVITTSDLTAFWSEEYPRS